MEHNSAIVIAMFGTTVESALKGILNIQDKMTARYPNTPVRFAFTSNIIRKRWQKRAADPEYRQLHPGIPTEVFEVKTVLATIADLQDQGYDSIVLQPTHIVMGEEFLDLGTYVDSLLRMGTIKKKKYKPFYKIALGRPALGMYGTAHPYAEDILAAAKALASDAELARSAQAALVYMGHGNEHFPSAGSYLELAHQMRTLYPDGVTLIGNVEGFPPLSNVIDELKRLGVTRVLLKPFMIVAGDHSVNDMAGPEEDSWKSVLEKNGCTVVVAESGLGEIDAFAELFVRNAGEAAADAGISLKA